MSVYVDELINFGNPDAPRCFKNRPSCHMFADTLDELHVMAKQLGLKREWFQNSPTLKHYDLTPSKRNLAIAKGVISLNRRDAVNKWKELRNVKKD